MKNLLALCAFLTAQIVVGAAPASQTILSCKTKAEEHSLNKKNQTHSIVFFDPAIHSKIINDLLKQTLNIFYNQKALDELSKTSITKILFVDDEPAGFISFKRLDDENASITWIVIKPRFQNKGLGSILLSETLNLMRKTGIKKVSLIPENEKSFSFYTKHGFKFCSHWRFEYHFIESKK